MSEPFRMVAKVELMRAVGGLKLPAYEMKTLIVLCSLINQRSGYAFPTHATLADLTNIHERHVHRALNGLQRRGFVVIAEQGTRRHSTRYTVDAAAVIATCRGASVPPVEVPLSHLYGCLCATCRGATVPPVEVVKGQLRASEVQTKRQPKLLPASRSTRPSSNAAGGRADQRATKPTRNAWLQNYKKPPPKPLQVAD